MAVPKKRTTSASRGQRRAHDAARPVQLVPSSQTSKLVPRRLKKAIALGLVKTDKD